MKKRRALRLGLPGLFLVITAVFPGFASGNTVSGTVFHDQSGDGTQNPSEPGLAEIAVSNGRDVALTDNFGTFKIEGLPNDFIFVVKPTGWKVPLDANHRPRFFRRISSGTGLNFPLTPQTEPDEFQVLVTTDPQVNSEQEIAFYEQSIVQPLSEKKGPAFGVTLGDIVNDHFELFGKMAATTGKIGIPWYDLNGNHDLDFSAPPGKALALYETAHGPATYAFEYARVLFIALDDIRPKKEGGYTGGLEENQFQFIEQLLQRTSPGKRVVIMLHIPLFQNGSLGEETFRRKDRDRLFQMLSSRKETLVLSGHTHSQCHVFHSLPEGWPGSVPLHEYNVAAACGSFWGGKPDADGIPVATMWDGTPPGCALVTFTGTENYQIDYLPSRRDPSFQIGICAPASARSGEAWVSFYANVFNGHDQWKVEFKIGDQVWKPMKRIEAADPAYFEAFLEQNSAQPPFPGRRLPDPVTCRHLWRAYLPKDLPPGKQLLEIRATEPSGKSHSARTEIVLVEKSP